MINNLRWYLVGGLIALAGAVGTASAELVDINFTVAGASVTGSGFAEVDDSLLTGNFVDTNLADLDDFSMTLNGIPGGGAATTSFSESDLTLWITSQSGGSFTDLNFFMRNSGLTNADGYSIEGFSPFHGVLCEGPAVDDACARTTLDSYVISVSSVTPASSTPEPGTMELLMSGIGAIAFFGRRRFRNN
jgi:PEP-CTERM motif